MVQDNFNSNYFYLDRVHMIFCFIQKKLLNSKPGFDFKFKIDFFILNDCFAKKKCFLESSDDIIAAVSWNRRQVARR
jgi:hypothetical protein